jgi:8-oxo-dGTP pyrophosphatase MutT (NUDIX family)
VKNAIQQLSERIGLYQPRQIHQPDMKQAGVLIAIKNIEDPHIILTLRSGKLSTHAGEVSFPGGKKDPEDTSIIHTALRETHEEIGIEPKNIEIIGELDQVISRFGYIITPVLGLVKGTPEIIANADEIEAVFDVPLHYFMNHAPSEFLTRDNINVPTYYYQGYKIWGITSFIIVEMMNNHFNASIKF